MSAARRVVVGIENDDGSTVVWRLDSQLGRLEVGENFTGFIWPPSRPAEFSLSIRGKGQRIDTAGPVDIQQLPLPPGERYYHQPDELET